MKIAYLILCHKDPNHVNRLINALNSDDVFFYLHIDKKSTIREEINIQDNITVLDNNVNVQWGSSNMILATMHLLQEASKEKYDYLFLISGQDYPIYSNYDITCFLEKSYGKQFIHYFDLPNKIC